MPDRSRNPWGEDLTDWDRGPVISFEYEFKIARREFESLMLMLRPVFRETDDQRREALELLQRLLARVQELKAEALEGVDLHMCLKLPPESRPQTLMDRDWRKLKTAKPSR